MSCRRLVENIMTAQLLFLGSLLFGSPSPVVASGAPKPLADATRVPVSIAADSVVPAIPSADPTVPKPSTADALEALTTGPSAPSLLPDATAPWSTPPAAVSPPPLPTLSPTGPILPQPLIPVPTPATPTWATVVIKDCLECSIVRVLPATGPQLSAEVARLLRWRGDVTRQIHRGDTLQILFQPGTTEPDILALHFSGAEINLRAYRHIDADGIGRYYDAEGVLVEPELVNAPVPGYTQITETVQSGRGKRRHHGIDLKAPEGAPIRLPFPGVVARVNWHQRVNGNCIEVAYDNGKVGRFLHLSYIDHSVHPGVHLQAGTNLGRVGSTGHSNASHLHYEILVAGKPVEPLLIHGHRTVHLDRHAMPMFVALRQALDRALNGPTPTALALSGSSAVRDCIPVSTDVQKPLGCLP